MKFSKEELIRETGAEVLSDIGEDCKYSISTDTRSIQSGDIYLPLKGETFDGEKFISSAVKNGTKAYFTTNNEVFDGAEFVLKVENTLTAYMKLAGYIREKLNPTVVAVTGSCGKTTTKELIYSVLSYKFKTHKTFSNHNNEIGFCQTVLSMPENTQMLIVEAGMRGLGEIKLISDYLKPDYAVITNSGSAHVGRLGSLDNIAKAKCEITSGLKKDGVFVSKNQDIIKKHLNFGGEKIFYSLDNVKFLEKSASYSKFIYKDNEYELFTDGDYNVENSLAAIEIGLKSGMTPSETAKGLASYKPIEKRWEQLDICGYKFINDSYNANPESMKASVKTFLEFYQNPVVILGDMGELGENEVEYHKQVGEFIGKYLSDKNIDCKFLTVGKLSSEMAKVLTAYGQTVKSFDENQMAACYIVENLDKDNTIFLKASRSMKFEQIPEYVKRGIDKL